MVLLAQGGLYNPIGNQDLATKDTVPLTMTTGSGLIMGLRTSTLAIILIPGIDEVASGHTRS